MKKKLLIVLASLIVLFGLFDMVGATTLTYAPSFANSSGLGGGNLIPFSSTHDIHRYQQFYHSSTFGGQAGIITEIWFRTDLRGFYTYSEDDFTASEKIHVIITLAHNQRGYLTDSLDSNLQTDQTLVVNGYIDLIGLEKNDPTDFNIKIDLNDSWKVQVIHCTC